MPRIQDQDAGSRRGRGREGSAPTRTRFRVLALACGLAVITYIHRVGFATASAEIKEPLGLSDRHLGWLMAAFMVAYGLFEMPWGLLGDRLGVRNILAVIILGGSVLTAALPLVVFLPRGLGWVLALLAGPAFSLRRLPGRDVSVDLADDGRLDAGQRAGSAHRGCSGCPAGSGGAVAPSLLVWLFPIDGRLEDARWCWRRALGLAWCAVFWPWFRNRPEDMPAGQQGGARAHPWRPGRARLAAATGRSRGRGCSRRGASWPCARCTASSVTAGTSFSRCCRRT